jgi:teichoic acid transport system permease protein
VTRPSSTMDNVQDQTTTDAVGSTNAAAVAARYGLRRVGTRPPLREYLRLLWSRRHFIRALATSKAYAKNQNNYLGQFWAVLNPILTAAAYLFVFGFLLDTTRGVDNYIAFLVIGMFMYRFTSTSITAGAKSIVGNLSLVRSLHFPRAVLPTAAVLSELVSLVPVLAVMCLIVLVTGEPITWAWLLLPFAIGLQWLFNTGCACIVTRAVASARDLLNVLPIFLRILLYISGVFFSVQAYVGDGPLSAVLEYQPVAVYLTLARSCLLADPPVSPSPMLWAVAVGWALVFAVGGFLFFWRAEERYGRD